MDHAQVPKIIHNLAEIGKDELCKQLKLGPLSEKVFSGTWTVSQDVLSATADIKIVNVVLLKADSTCDVM